METVKIMVVENQLLTARSMRIALEDKGYQVTAVTVSGAEALKAIHKDLPDLIIMDIHLDGPIDGITTAKAINAEYRIPIIYVTQFDDDNVFRVAKETRPKNFITKPFTDSMLIRAVELALQQRPMPSITYNASRTASITVADAFFALTTNGTHRRVFFRDILYIESSSAYTKIFIQQESSPSECILVTVSSNHVINQLCCESIAQVHKSYHVNLQKVDLIRDHQLFIGDIEIPVSKGFRKAVYGRFLFIQRNYNKT